MNNKYLNVNHRIRNFVILILGFEICHMIFQPDSRKSGPLAVDECQLLAGMSPRSSVSQVPRALPVGLLFFLKVMQIHPSL
jgi:hypothetical protein